MLLRTASEYGEELVTEELAEQLSKDDPQQSETDTAIPVRTLTIKSMQEVYYLY